HDPAADAAVELFNEGDDVFDEVGHVGHEGDVALDAIGLKPGGGHRGGVANAGGFRRLVELLPHAGRGFDVHHGSGAESQRQAVATGATADIDYHVARLQVGGEGEQVGTGLPAGIVAQELCHGAAPAI